jgi:hypothetical protein
MWTVRVNSTAWRAYFFTRSIEPKKRRKTQKLIESIRPSNRIAEGALKRISA